MYAPTPDSQAPEPQLTRKRRSPRHAEKAPPRKKSTTSDKRASSQRRRSDALHATRSPTKSNAHKDNESTDKNLAIVAAAAIHVKRRQSDQQEHAIQSTNTDRNPASQTEISITNCTFPDDNDDDDFGQLCFDFDIHTCDTDISLHSTRVPEQTDPSPAHFDDNDFDDDFDDNLMDEDLLGLASDLSDDSTIQQRQTPVAINGPVISNSFQYRLTPDGTPNTTVAADAKCNSPSLVTKKFASPVTLTTRMLAAAGDEAQKPIVRPPFPAAVRDRSPVIGMSASTLLRSCFRVGEAISQSCHAAKAGSNIVIELYARILDSDRDDMRQRFTFCDLFHARPPYIHATYAAAIWRTVQLFEYDSARLMQQGRICRCIGTMRRNGKDWVMTVLNIWEATWDDVQWVEGIVNF